MTSLEIVGLVAIILISCFAIVAIIVAIPLLRLLNRVKLLIEKLNEGLIQLIEAYEILQGKNEILEDEIKDLNAKNTDLEYKLSDFNNNNEEQDTKMDGMLNKIQNLLQVNTSELINFASIFLTK